MPRLPWEALPSYVYLTKCHPLLEGQIGTHILYPTIGNFFPFWNMFCPELLLRAAQNGSVSPWVSDDTVSEVFMFMFFILFVQQRMEEHKRFYFEGYQKN